jgi:hypothetical protein
MSEKINLPSMRQAVANQTVSLRRVTPDRVQRDPSLRAQRSLDVNGLFVDKHALQELLEKAGVPFPQKPRFGLTYQSSTGDFARTELRPTREYSTGQSLDDDGFDGRFYSAWGGPVSGVHPNVRSARLSLLNGPGGEELAATVVPVQRSAIPYVEGFAAANE